MGVISKAELIEKARVAAESAYAPYSKFRVGAAVATELGVFSGANVENACYNLGICAERVALSQAVLAGAKQISVVAVCCIDADGSQAANTMPCGGCRQWLWELAPEALVVTNGKPEGVTVRELLPEGFVLQRG